MDKEDFQCTDENREMDSRNYYENKQSYVGSDGKKVW